MKKIYLLLVVLCLGFGQVRGQEFIDLPAIDNILPEAKIKMDDALAVADAVKKAGAYIESLADLFTDGELTLPVGIKKGDYELIVHRIEYSASSPKPKIYATCAFKFKDTGQTIAFEGEAVLTGKLTEASATATPFHILITSFPPCEKYFFGGISSSRTFPYRSGLR
ncbi:hypothetical protein AGMMS4957_14720 [Bacteroidia bacterium]|nr:hypothetical protein AGMMS4957_14720 [Bacteroidia bacterium]